MDKFCWICSISLRVDLADARGASPPAPPLDETWLPFSNTSQKGGVHSDRGRWGDMRFFGVDCILREDMCYVLMMWSCVHVRGRHCFYIFMFLILLMIMFLFHKLWYIGYDLYYEVIHGICLYFLFCENKKFILVYLYFPYMRLWFV